MSSLNGLQRKETGGTGYWRKNGDHSDHRTVKPEYFEESLVTWRDLASFWLQWKTTSLGWCKKKIARGKIKIIIILMQPPDIELISK